MAHKGGESIKRLAKSVELKTRLAMEADQMRDAGVVVPAIMRNV